MSIADDYKTNFETLQRAFREGRAALVECRERTTGKEVVAICAISGPDAAGELTIVPFGRMFDSNPYEELDPPNPDGGFYGVPEDPGTGKSEPAPYKKHYGGGGLRLTLCGRPRNKVPGGSTDVWDAVTCPACLERRRSQP